MTDTSTTVTNIEWTRQISPNELLRRNVEAKERWILLIGGSALTLYGLFQRSFAGLLLVIGGGYLVYRGLSGDSPLYEMMDITKTTVHKDSPEEAGTERTIKKGDRVEEASWESFPASDPPAWTSRRRTENAEL